MRFASGNPRRRRDNPWPPARRLGLALVVCCLVAIVACAFPWVRVAFERLFPGATGPRGLHTTEGFTCLVTCVLTAMLVSFETRSAAVREATRSACAVMMLLAGLAITARFVAGPGSLRGATATNSGWFYAALAAVAAGAACGLLRYRQRVRPGA